MSMGPARPMPTRPLYHFVYKGGSLQRKSSRSGDANRRAPCCQRYSSLAIAASIRSLTAVAAPIDAGAPQVRGLHRWVDKRGRDPRPWPHSPLPLDNRQDGHSHRPADASYRRLPDDPPPRGERELPNQNRLPRIALAAELGRRGREAAAARGTLPTLDDLEFLFA
jgi:hypothetical protein